MNTRFLCTLLLVLGISTLQAEIKLPQLIGDNMVLQQQTDIRLWGEATPDSWVDVNASWLTKTPATVKADANGRWELWLKTPEASFDPQFIVLNDGGTPVTINNVLIGEVWFCSGQSNMEMPLNGFWHSPIERANEVIADAGNHSGIRMATIERKGALTPQEYANGDWKVSSPENAPWFGATAYFYALHLQRTLKVPVGLINCSWGGSRVEGWLPEEILRTFPDEDLSKAESSEGIEWMKPMIMYNGLLKPSSKYTIKGFLWYQGCSNVGHADVYAERLAIMVNHWRELWGNDALPFYYVEIAPYNYDNNPNEISGALLREAQLKAQSLIAHSAMVTTNDLVYPYEGPQIHPCKKEEIGQRLAWQALNKTYGFESVTADSPAYKEIQIENNQAYVSFHNDQEGFSPWQDIEGFEIAGADRVFYPAKASLNQNRKAIVVTSEKVAAPVAVRYCFKNFQTGNLIGHRNLPVIPFRTDNW